MSVIAKVLVALMVASGSVGFAVGSLPVKAATVGQADGKQADYRTVPSRIQRFVDGPIQERPLATLSDPPLLIAQDDAYDHLSDEAKEQLGELLRQAEENIDRRDYAAAIAAYQQASQIDPENPRIYSGIGYLQIQQANYQAAIAAYRQAIDLDPRNVPFRYGLAFSLVSSGSLQEATAVYQELIRMAPAEADAYLGLGGIFIQQEDYAGALETYEQLVTRDPRNSEAIEALGNLYVLQERYDDARDAYERSLQIRPSGSAYQGLGEICQTEGDADCAYDAYSQAVAIDSDNAQALLGLAQILSDRGETERAQPYYVRAADADPTLIPAQAAAGEVFLENEQYLRAIATYRRLVRALPNNPGARYNLALALYGQGWELQAVAELRIAKDLYRNQENTEGASRAEQLLEFWGVIIDDA